MPVKQFLDDLNGFVAGLFKSSQQEIGRNRAHTQEPSPRTASEGYTEELEQAIEEARSFRPFGG